MILGVGSDLVEIPRLERAISRHGAGFLARLFTAGEQARCAQLHRPAPCYAKRFAAKEAVVKALGCGMRDGVWFTQVEVVNDPLGRPGVVLHGAARERLQAMGGERIHLSLSDERNLALAFAVVEGAGECG